MPNSPLVQPLPRNKRRITFWTFLAIFLLSLPFLFFYATGYRYNGEDISLVGTGGLYIATERTGAEIYIDGEMVKETRAFRRAFYAQSIEPGTHRVHVQKEGHHTWVKELPVVAHRVTEAQAFNLPLVPEVRVITEWVSATGSPIVATTTFSLVASTTNESFVATTTKATSTFSRNSEYLTLRELFGTTSTSTAGKSLQARVSKEINAVFSNATTSTSTESAPTTTKEWQDVRLYENGDELYVAWSGSRESMPYFYCAESFPPYSTTTEKVINPALVSEAIPTPKEPPSEDVVEFMHPIQTVPENAACEPAIKMDRKGQKIRAFDFFPGSTDLILMLLDEGVYVAEVDGRSWQNVQPLVTGRILDMKILNGQIYVYDGKLMYQIILEEY